MLTSLSGRGRWLDILSLLKIVVLTDFVVLIRIELHTFGDSHSHHPNLCFLDGVKKIRSE